MTKLVLFPVLLAAGCVMAGVYGMLHNQISYTVAPDYFFAYTFALSQGPRAGQLIESCCGLSICPPRL